MTVVRYIFIIMIFSLSFSTFKTNADGLLFKQNNNLEKNLKTKKNEEFKCFKSSRKYISGQKSLVLGIGNLKFNFLNFDGYRQVNQYKCIVK